MDLVNKIWYFCIISFNSKICNHISIFTWFKMCLFHWILITHYSLLKQVSVVIWRLIFWCIIVNSIYGTICTILFILCLFVYVWEGLYRLFYFNFLSHILPIDYNILLIYLYTLLVSLIYSIYYLDNILCKIVQIVNEL